MTNRIGKLEEVLVVSTGLFAHALVLPRTEASRGALKDEYLVHAFSAKRRRS